MATSTTGPALGADIIAYRGDSFDRWIRIARNGVEEVLQTSSFTMHIKNGNTIVFILSSNLGSISVESNGTESAGVLHLAISHDEMAAINPGQYQYDMQQAYPDGKVRTRFRGSFTITDDVTKVS